MPGRPGCFHYFPFFRSLLLAELSYESPERLAEVRRIASGWYRTHERYAESLALLATIGAWQEMATQLVDDGLVGRLLLEAQAGALVDVARRLPAVRRPPRGLGGARRDGAAAGRGGQGALRPGARVGAAGPSRRGPRPPAGGGARR